MLSFSGASSSFAPTSVARSRAKSLCVSTTPFVKPRIRHASVLVEHAVDEKSGEMHSLTSLHFSPDDSRTRNLKEAIRSPSSRDSINSGLATLDDMPEPSRAKQLFNKIKAKAMHGLDQDINDSTAEVDQVHDNSTSYDEKRRSSFAPSRF